MMENKPVRVRFAPSPTGPLHIGGVRTALYNYLLAKKTGGTMILRIEDTDQNRYVEGAETYIKEALEWVGIALDESPWNGGPYAPYRQSERREIYMQYAQKLVDEGNAYYAFDTSEALDEMRSRLEAAKVPDPKYNSITRMQMMNSITLPENEVQDWLASGKPYVIRLKVPRKEEVRLNDMIRSWVMVHSSSLDDKVLMKSDGMPTYHLANVVDDYLMKITHVIRGEEWLPSAPTHVLLYKFLGWESVMPQFAHLPLLLKPDGNGKLSKRDGDLGGYPVFPLEWKDAASGSVFKGFRESGFLPEATMNFLALLGWNPGNHKELFTKEELIETFSIERIGKSGSKFDINKAKWFNQEYIKLKTNEELAEFLEREYVKEGYSFKRSDLIKVCGLLKDRITFMSDLQNEAIYFFFAPETYDNDVVGAKWDEEALEVAKGWIEKLKLLEEVDSATAKSSLNEITASKGIKTGKVMQAMRVALTGLAHGADLMQLIEIIGKKAAIARLENAVQRLPLKTEGVGAS